jgi:hypothetical protein
MATDERVRGGRPRLTVVPGWLFDPPATPAILLLDQRTSRIPEADRS